MTKKSILFKNGKLFNEFLKNVLLCMNPEIEYTKDKLYLKNLDSYPVAFSRTGFKYGDITLNEMVLFYSLEFNNNSNSSMIIDKINKILNEQNKHKFKAVLLIFGISEEIIRKEFNKIESNEKIYIISKTKEQWVDEYPVAYLETQPLDRLFNHQQVDKMSLEDFFNNNKMVINSLNMDIKKGNLSIALGAGISYDFGAPSWEELIKSFEEDETFISTRVSDNLKKMIGSTELIHAQLYKNILNDDKYFSRIYSKLYGNYSPKSISKDKTIYHVASLINRYSTKNNLKIISYNYDNFLEQYLDKYFNDKPNFEVIYDETGITKTSIPIYHVHGFLPFTNDSNLEENHNKINSKYRDSIKLTEDNYYYLYNNPYSWQIVTQLEIFRNSTCLFIGCSLTDPNIRRLLKLANNSKKYHYAIMAIKDLKVFDLIVIGKHFQSMGVKIIWIPDHQHKNYEKILDIIYN